MNKRQNKGITLIALVITIIVLIILAGISMNILIGQNGIITKTIDAELTHDIGSLQEEVGFYVSETMFSDSIHWPTLDGTKNGPIDIADFPELGKYENKYGEGAFSLRDGSVIIQQMGSEILTGVKDIEFGLSHGCAITNDGALRTWGENWSGHLGLGDFEDRDRATIVPGMSDIKQLDTTEAMTVILKEDGTVWICGEAWQGSLGLGSEAEDTNVFTQIPGLAGVKSISAGGYHVLALLEDGTVKVWGMNNKRTIRSWR